MKKLVQSLLTITLITCTINNLNGTVDLGETHLPPFGHKTDCHQWKTDIEGTVKKANKSKDDIDKMDAQKHHYNTQNCDDKIKSKK